MVCLKVTRFARRVNDFGNVMVCLSESDPVSFLDRLGCGIQIDGEGHIVAFTAPSRDVFVRSASVRSVEVEATYDKQVDAVYLYMGFPGEDKVARTCPLEGFPEVFVDLAADERIIGFEFLNPKMSLCKAVLESAVQI